MIDNNDFIIRILKAKIENFQNVEHGEIHFACDYNGSIFQSGSDILGLYGQNGSGKTAFLRTLSTLRALLSGNRLPREARNYIAIGKDTASINFEFSITNDKVYYRGFYEARLKQRLSEEIDPQDNNQNIIILEKEKLSYKVFENGVWKKRQTLIETYYQDSQVFRPDVKLLEVTHQSQKCIDELRVAKKYAEKQSTSFIFSNDVVRYIIKSDNQEYKNIISALSFFGKSNLFVIDNRNSGLITARIGLPINFKYAAENALSIGSIAIKLNGSSVIPQRIYSVANNIIETMNIVLEQIIPTLKISLKNLGEHLLDEEEVGIVVELLSNRNGQSIPLKFESEGIIKIISILHLLIYMYNNPSMTLAIDEIDSGIFEYLLGEILKIIDDAGKGQLIFTSHNLRPLETLHRKSIVFTTTNPLNRYIRLTNVKTNNNLRDFYYHDIMLGGQKENLYDETNIYAIKYAFRQAGEVNE